MKICHVEVQIWNFFVEFFHIGAVKMLDIKYGCGQLCVEVKYHPWPEIIE